MSIEILACRGCRHPLSSDAGCELCLGVKRHLIVQSADDDSVPLHVIATETVAVLRTQLKGTKDANEQRAIASTIAKVLDASRKVIQDGADAVEAMSFQEKAQLFLDWTAGLPGAYRNKLVDEMLKQGQARGE